MTADATGHATAIVVDGPTEVAAGADFAMTLRVSCPAGCDLSGIPIEVTAPDGATTLVEPAVGGPDLGARRLPLKAPLRIGEHIWRISCAAHESGGCCHDATLLRVPVRTRPQETSLAVWAIPSPVVMGKPFVIKAGAKSAAGCRLAGLCIVVCDDTGAVLASGTLGEVPFPGTSALYWCELAMNAPAKAGIFSWSVRFDAADLEVPHLGASSRFSIAIVPPAAHRLTVRVMETETAAPIVNAQVRLGAYRAATGETGFAELMLPKGSYDLDVWKSGYEAPTTPITVDADVTVEVAITAMPEEDPDAAWLM